MFFTREFQERQVENMFLINFDYEGGHLGLIQFLGDSNVANAIASDNISLLNDEQLQMAFFKLNDFEQEPSEDDGEEPYGFEKEVV